MMTQAPTDGRSPPGSVGRVKSVPAPELDAVEALYRAEGTRLWRAVRAYASSPSVADDAVAEAFAQLIRRGTEVRDRRAWVWRVAFRIAAGELQRRRRELNEPAVDPSYHDVYAAIDLYQALRTLSPSQRAALVLHEYAGYPAIEIANIIGSTEAAVRVHLMRARRRLRSLLDEQQSGCPRDARVPEGQESVPRQGAPAAVPA
jgi:RNA polymerase sigma-70 factor (ECF subfamily)